MSEYAFEDDIVEETDSSKDPVRARLRELEKQNKKFEQALADRDKQLNEYQIRDVLSERGITDKRNLTRASRWMKADGIDLADQKAVDGWLDDNGDAIGYSTPVEEPEDHQQARQALDRMRATESQGTPSSRQNEILQEIAAAQTPDELDRIRMKYADVKITS